MELKVKNLFNAEIKQKYLDTIENEGTKTTIYFQLLNAKSTEEQLEKDLYEMNIDEIALVMYDISCSTLTSVTNHLFCYNSYITWAIKEGFTKGSSNFSVLESKDFYEWGKQFVATYKTRIFTREKVLKMTNELVNYTDRALILALFEGISGSGFSEILNLKTSDLRQDESKYFAHLYDSDGTEREIEISKELYENLIRADEEKMYINANEMSTNPRSATSLYVESDRIFKKALRGRQSGENLLDRMFITRKFLLFKKVFNNKYLTARDFLKSGMCHMAYELYKKHGTLGTKEYRMIGDQFNTAMTNTGGNYYRNVTVIKRTVCTDSFKEVYGVSVCE
ncbi:hypothetical protein [Siminovitchia sp. 179-K 8D1 HS]|uniref:phage lytic cycle repressor MrpR family protein n=1 Tax=Siminovitchia sp. 179-K 8D1 HS TaxID=3142385 RepID=UPI0039A2E4DB